MKSDEDRPLVTFTPAAEERVSSFMESSAATDYVVRLAIQGRTSTGFRYDMGLVPRDAATAADTLVEVGRLTVLVDGASASKLRGVTVDYVIDDQGNGGIQIDNPNSIWDSPQAIRVQELLDTRINPMVASHGGMVDLLEVVENRVYLKLGGGCVGCGMVNVTLKQGIEVILREAMPEIEEVIDQTDHAAGTNPYTSRRRRRGSQQSTVLSPQSVVW